MIIVHATAPKLRLNGPEQTYHRALDCLVRYDIGQSCVDGVDGVVTSDGGKRQGSFSQSSHHGSQAPLQVVNTIVKPASRMDNLRCCIEKE